MQNPLPIPRALRGLFERELLGLLLADGDGERIGVGEFAGYLKS